MAKTNGGKTNAAQRIILRFGGQTGLAKLLERPQSTVQYWSRTGAIPVKWHQKLIDLAQLHGVSLAPSDFAAVVVANAEIARRPEAKWPGALEVAGVDIPCYVLDDGRRVISRTGALNFLTGGKGGGNLESYLKVEYLKPFLPDDLSDQFIDVMLPQVVNKDVKGLTAHAFIDICRAYSRARDTGAMTTETQVGMAVRASAVLSAFAKVGIEAAIDEATGYQYVRAEDAMRMKLNLFLADEMRPWEKTFPDELWVQFGRLTRWRGPIHERPKYWGKLVNELIYGYLDADVLDWLKKNAPKPRHGQNYHQWINAQYGLKKLVEHIWMTIGIATVCHDMRELRQRMAERFGREAVQFMLFLPPTSPGRLGT